MIFERQRSSFRRTVFSLVLLFVYTGSTAEVTKSSVIIIGAGASGIAAGTKLYKNGIEDIIWLEAENRIGGRVYTKEFGDRVIDLGAQWCHGVVGNLVYEMAYPLNLLEHSKYNGTEMDDIPFEFYDSTGASLPVKNTTRVHQVISELIEEPDNEEMLQKFNKSSVGEYVTCGFKQKLQTDLAGIDKELCQMVFDWFQKGQNSLDASDTWYDVSPRGYSDYWDCDGDKQVNWKGKGYKTFLNVLMNKIPDPSKALPIDDKFHLNKEVTNIEWHNNNEVTITCADGSVYKADHVIVTVSLAVLKERHSKLFTPELPPTNLRAIEGLGMGVLDKLIFEYPSSWWPEDHDGFNFLWHKNNIENIQDKFNGSVEDNLWLTDVFGFYPVEDKPRVLLGWLSGKSARKMETLSENVVKEKLIQLLDMFLGSKFTIPRPSNFIRSTWYTNPHFRGSYSYRDVLADQLNTSPEDLAQPLKNDQGRECVFFAGEGTNTHRYGTVHGAVETGWREAERIIQLKKDHLEQKNR